jgi:2-polyprenyl-6-methoxyphenol hydroxylase-like FAD-dependent oxidoreductase
MAAALNVAIVGYGIAGIAAAIRLRALGHRIAHFDRNDPPAADGAGMLLHPPALLQLEQLGVLQEANACGVPVRRIVARSADGRPLMDMDYAELAAGTHGLGIQRGTLHRLLAQADAGRTAVAAGCDIRSLDAREGTLFDATGRRCGRFDLIVVADGTHSMLREQLTGLLHRDRRSHSAAVVGLLDDPDGFASDALAQYFDGPRHLSMWPVGATSTSGPRRCAVAMNVPLAGVAPLRDQPAWRARMLRLCPQMHRVLDRQPALLNLHAYTWRDVDLEDYCIGRAVLIGDAAHCMSPQLGIGAQTALEDAQILGTALAAGGDLHTALRAYTRLRKPRISRYQQASRWLTPLFQSDSRLLSLVRVRLLASSAQLGFIKHIARTVLAP